jgi:hypothetical protein
MSKLERGILESKEECQEILQTLVSKTPPEITKSDSNSYYLDGSQLLQVERLIRDSTFPREDTKEPQVHCGTLLTDVSAVRADLNQGKWSEYATELGARDLYGLDMEGIGLYQAIETINRNRNPKIKVILVKGVSDLAGPDKDDQFHVYGKQASALFICKFVQRYGYKLI